MKIHFLGGLGEIGANCTVYQTDNVSLIIDFGIKFPRVKTIGIDKIYTNSKILPQNKKILLITHIHEDHIGAFFEIYHQVDHIYLPKLAFEFLQEKAKKELILSKFTIYDHNSKISIAQEFDLYPFETFHSTPETYGIMIHFKQQLITHLSDFKSNRKTIFKHANSQFDFANQHFKKHLFLSDSTNMSSQKRYDHSEEEVAQGIKRIFDRNHRRYFITLFGSNIERIHNIQRIAFDLGMKCHFLGNSLNFYNKISHYMTKPPEHMDNREPSLYFVTGSQGEKFSQLWRMARDQGDVLLNSEDAVIFSSRSIPGNDQSFYHMLNLLSSKTNHIYLDGEEPIHCSGHAYKGDLEIAVKELRPTHVLPIHGENFHLSKACRFITDIFSLPVTKAYPHSLFDFDSLALSANPNPNTEPEIFIDQNGGHKIESEDIKNRTKLGNKGLVIISLEYKKIKLIGVPSASKITDQLNHELSHFSKSDTMVLTLIKRRLEEKIGYVPMIIHS